MENSKFEIMLPDKIETNPEPIDEELRILREKIYHTGATLGK